MTSTPQSASDSVSPAPSIFSVMKAHASLRPEAQAIVTDDLTITYGELFERIASWMDFLLRRGLVPGETTGISIRHEVDHLLCAMALLCLGAPQVNLPTQDGAANKRSLAHRLDVNQVVAERAEDWMDGMTCIVRPLPAEIAPVSTAGLDRFDESRQDDSIALYLNTSGSTRTPLSVEVRLRRLLKIAEWCAAEPSEQRVLRTSAIEFDATRFCRIYTLLAGATTIFSGRIVLEQLGALCARAEVSSIQVGAYRLGTLLGNRTSAVQRLPAFTRIVAGGTRVPGPLREKVRAVLTENLWVSYATSEVAGISLATPDQHPLFPEGVGFPLEGVSVEIVDENDAAIVPGGIGRIRVRKANMVSRYASDPDRSPRFRDGWFYPGDLFSQNEGCPLIFHGREADVMVLNGLKIFASLIEDTLASHPDVEEAVAYPIKSRVHGDIPAAAVVLSGNAQSRDPAQLLGYCRQLLGARGPRHIVVVDSIPRTQAGKPLRRTLSES
jgi:acyl-CoA synthetase (AMP-forming)/AMP-acid ligase II